MAKDERRRRRRRRRKKKKGSRAGHQASASEQTEDEEEEHFRPPHKLKLVLKLPRPYPSSSFQATNSSSSSIPTTNLPPRGEASASTSTSGDLSDTSSSPNPTQKQRDEVEAEDDVTVVHSRKPLPPALHSPSALSSSFGEDDATEEEDEEDDDNDDDDDDGGDGNDTDMEEKPPKKRKLNAVAPVTIAYGSQIPSDAHPSAWCSNKTEKKNQYPDVTNSVPDPVSKTPVPEKKMVHFILDKLQKKDSYGVFSEPVDPEELPDYHRVIQHPMDFGTIRKKLAKGDYTCLEELEMDVFLICTNAMHYNASITIYYKQARAIQELAKKKFASIRLDPERIEAELRLASKKKPGYSSKKTRKPGLGRFQFEPTSSDLFSGATLATVGDYSNWSNASLQDSTRIRRAATAERPANGPGYSGISGWTLKAYGSADGFGPLTETKAEKSEELQGSMHKALRNGRRSLQLEENHRATYKPYYHVENQNDAIFAMLNGESKQLIPIGLRSEYAYATSLCRFAANAGPVAWMIAAQKIQRALPPHVPFGPGWVGDYEAPPRSLSSQKGRSAALSGSSLPDILRQSKVKLNTSSDAPIISGGELPKNLISECRSVPSSTQTSLVKQLVSNSTVRQPPDYCLSSSNGRSDVNKIAGLNTYGDIKVSLPSHEVNHGPIKAILPVATSNDLSLPNTKFGSEVTQSRLLEMVSRNNTYIHRPSLKQDDVSNPIKSFQVKQSESMTIDGEGCGLAREASDTLKHVCSPAEINAPATRPKTSLNDYQAGSVAFQASQATNNRGNNMQKSNSVDNFMCSKMLAMHQRGSNLSVNSPVFVNSSFLSTDPSIKRNDPTVQAWMQSQNACLAEADAASRNKMPDTTSSHTEQHESQSRNFSAITCVVSKEMQLDVQCQPFSQYSRFHSQNSAKLSNNTPVSGPAVESQGPKIGIPSYVQMPEGIESFESHMHSWKGLPTQFLSEPVSDLSPSKPLNLNLGLQKPKSPARQFSGMSADSQQPDLALQL